MKRGEALAKGRKGKKGYELKERKGNIFED